MIAHTYGVKFVAMDMNSSNGSTQETSGCRRVSQFAESSDVVILLLVVFGVCGNILSYITFSIRRPPTLATVYLKALAMADISFLLSSLVWLFLKHIPSLDNQTIKSIIALVIYGGFADIAQFTSVWITVLLAFSRFLAIYKPFFVKTHMVTKTIRKSVITVVVMACIIVAARMWMVIEKEVKTYTNETHCIFCPDYGVRQTQIIESCFYGGLLFLLPALLLAVFSGSLLVNLKRSYTRWCHPNLQQEYRDVGKTVLVIVLVFLLTYAPYGLWALTYLNQHLQYCDAKLLDTSIHLAVHINSSVNVVIYMTCKASFRESFRQLSCRRSNSWAAFVH